MLASENYPASSTKNAPIEIDADLEGDLYHMGTKEEEGTLKTNGGRVLMLVSLADTLEEAMASTYAQLPKIHCDKLFYRTDIGRKDLENGQD